ncbi:MAG: hypothetical protein JSS02_35100, partial [Planctomycetes bacterium]|nr:hypothetical protein [Planctomycetota bacterium]
VGTGLAVCSLCLSFLAESSAQSPGSAAAPKKKKPAVVQTRGEDVADAPAPKRRIPVETDPNAGEGAPSRGKGEKPQRPAPQELRIEPVPPELEEVLQEWESKTAQFKKLVGEFTVFKYDLTFETEKRGQGKFAYEAPDKGNYERTGLELEKGLKSKKKNKDGEPFTLQSLTPERWVCNGKEIVQINEIEKTFWRLAIPPEAQGQNIIEGPLPFLFGMKAQQAKMRYRMKLVERTADEITLQVIPLRKSDASNWEKAVVMIDAKRFVPKAVKLFDPTNNETVHLFRNVEINPKSGFLTKDPFKPNLRGYKEAQTRDAQVGAADKSAEKGAEKTAEKGTAAKTRSSGEEAIKRTSNNVEAPARKGGDKK